MSRILAAVHGTTGDILPMLRLGCALVRRGHDVTVCSTPGHAAVAARLGLPFQAAGPPFGPENIQRVYDRASAGGFSRSRAMVPFVEEVLRPYLVPGFHAISALAPRFDAIVANMPAIWARPAAEACGKPYATLHLTHLNLRSDAYSPDGVPVPPSRISINRRAWDVAAHANRRFLLEPLRAVYEESHIPLPAQVMGEESVSPWLNLLNIDPACVPPVPDWPANVVQTGFFRPEAAEFQPPSAELESFVEAGRGEPLIVFAFGSVGMRLTPALLASLAEVVVQKGGRALVISGWGSPIGPSGTATLNVPAVSYGWLFPHASLVFHHGGPGTAAEALLHGAPQVAVPHGFFDQYEVGTRIEALGCGRSVDFEDMTPTGMGRLLTEILPRLPALRARAAEIRARLLPDGRPAACAAIESLLR